MEKERIYPMAIKVSVITTTYNDIENLKKTIAGVSGQDYENIEYVIVDGGSKDGTVELIKESAKSFPGGIRWISEPDRGIYDAINKGIRMSTGDVVGFAFDEFADSHVISKMVQAIEDSGSDGVHGNIDYVDRDGKVVRKWRMGQGNIKSGWMPGHPTMYLKKELYDTYGLYKTEYKIAADYEFMIRMLKKKKVKLAYIDEVLVYMFYGENSTSTGGLSNYIASLKEGHRALKENGIYFAWITDLFRTFRVLKQFLG